MNQIQTRVNRNILKLETKFIESVLVIAQKYPQYSIEYIRDEMPIPIFISIIDLLNKIKPKENPKIKNGKSKT